MNCTKANRSESKQPVLIITGMHRSATSLTAMLLQSAGINIGQRLMPPTSENCDGYFEDLDFVEFHMRALRANGYADNGILAGGRLAMPERLIAAAVLLANARAGSPGPWGWKDPRTVLFLDFWKELLPDAAHVFVFRSPWEVVDSLFRRGTDEAICTNPPLALECWVHYNSLIRDFVVRHPTTCSLVEASDVANRPRTVLAGIQDHLGIALAEPESLSREGMLTSLAGSPRESFIRECAPEAAELYEDLQALAGDSNRPRTTKPRRVAKPKTATFEMGMGDWYSIYDERRQVAHWRNATTTTESTLATLQQQTNATRQELNAQDGLLTQLRAHISTLESEKAARNDEVDALNGRIAALQSERDASTTQAISSQTAAAQLESEVIALRTLEAEHARLSETMASLQSETAARDSRIAELSQTIAGLQQQRDASVALATSSQVAVANLESQLFVLRTLEAEHAHLSEATASLQSETAVRDSRIAELVQTIAGLQQERAALLARTEELNDLVAERDAAAKWCQEQRETDGKVITELRHAIVGLKWERSGREARTEELLALAAENEATAKSWQQRYDAAQAARIAIQKHAESLHHEGENLRVQVDELSAQIATKQSTSLTLQQQYEEECLRRQVASLTLTKQSLEQDIAQAELHMMNMEQALASVEQDCAAARSRVAELESLAAEQGQKMTGLATALENTSHDLQAVLQSKSWVLTSPLRELRRWLTHPRQRLAHYLAAGQTKRQHHAKSPPAQTPPSTNGVVAYAESNGHANGHTNGVYPPLVGPASDAGTAALMSLPEASANGTARTVEDACRLIAFYLPQYHCIPENDDWWGPGFTEWTNVARGRPNFDGHHQPQIPRELGFYDLSSPDVIQRQAEMARLYGISGFCFYHYWFSGRRVLERPLELFMQSDIDMPFCICWANENWTRTWDGDTKTVLLEQKYAPGDDELFFHSIVDVLRDKRYIRVDGKPLLIVYRAKHIPNPQQTFATWRRMACEAGLGGLHISVVDFYDISNPAEVDADSLLEFPPHKFNGPANVPNTVPPITNPSFSGGILDYRKMIAQSLHKVAPAFTYFRGIVPNWDNTARRQDTPTTIIHSTPEWYGRWLTYLRAYTRRHAKRPDEALVFINAWNEWGEGCHLEPDVKWGLQYLESTFRTRFVDPAATLENTTSQLHADLSNALSGQSPPPELSSVPSRETHGVVSAKATNGVYYRPVDERIHRIATALRKYPLVYGVARYTYRTYYRLRG